ncbi:hypothetical protein [uncultured Stutzerimonas sp.]|uniref:hypothetical protein n=1 Tax=uncultured Stutzerimonas sp. TaxID=2901168 RepID=UPI0032B1E24E
MDKQQALKWMVGRLLMIQSAPTAEFLGRMEVAAHEDIDAIIDMQLMSVEEVAGVVRQVQCAVSDRQAQFDAASNVVSLAMHRMQHESHFTGGAA